MNLIFEQIPLGNFGKNFGYILGDRESGECVLIDPAYVPAKLVARAQEQGLKVTHILNTHEHKDHINGNAKAKELTGAPIGAWHSSAVKPDTEFNKDSVVKIGKLSLEMLHTPGHSPDHLVFYEPSHNILISGDLLFVGKIGGVGCRSDAFAIAKSLEKVFARYPHHTTVWPGHDYGVRTSSTLGIELASNPFLGHDSFDEFINIVDNWTEVKKENGLV